MGRFHVRALRDLGCDVATVDPVTPGVDYRWVPGREFDVACIATPVEHLATEALVVRAPRILVEKPGGVSAGEVATLAEALGDAERVAVGYVERFNPGVRALRRALADVVPLHARFRRWNTRESRDARLDLMAHDVDLTAFLGLRCPVEYDAAAGQPVKIRDIDVRTAGRALHANLLAHTTSPLHAQWHAFLSGGEGCASLADAERVLERLEERVAA